VYCIQEILGVLSSVLYTGDTHCIDTDTVGTVLSSVLYTRDTYCIDTDTYGIRIV